MNAIIKTLVVIFTALLISGCATVEYRVQYKTKIIMPADDLLVNCNKAEPPNKTEYIKSNMSDREEALFDYSFKQTSNIQTCNLRWQALRNLKSKTIKELTEADNDAEVVDAK